MQKLVAAAFPSYGYEPTSDLVSSVILREFSLEV